MAQMKYFYELTISSSPHVHTHITTRIIMRDVLLALVPALIGSVCFFGFRALTVTLVSVAACLFWEWGYCRLLKMDSSIDDLSAAVTGVLLAFVCPVTIPYWTIVLGAFFAIIVVKMLFGGLGKNIVNPALAGRAFMFSWPVLMSTWVKVGYENAAGILSTADAVTAATPLAALHQYQLPKTSVLASFWGNVGGCLGETSVLLLLAGFAYLLVRKVITARIPVAFIGTVAVLTFLFPMGNARIDWMLYQVFSGGLMLGAIFMATDYVTSPLTRLGQIVYGIGCGVLTVLIRYFGGYPEGVSYAILCMNCCVVLLDRIGRPVKFGAPPEGGGKVMKNNVLYFTRLAVTLLLITSLVAAALAGVNSVTKPIIDRLTEEKTQQAIRTVLPGGYDRELADYADETGLVSRVYAGAEGYAFEVTPAGFDNTITMMVGVDTQGNVLGISVISHTETAGLGAVAAAETPAGEDFRNQFVGKNGSVAVSKDGGALDAITGATITSRAICDGVNAALACAATLN